jgi:hypothetical protein
MGPVSSHGTAMHATIEVSDPRDRVYGLLGLSTSETTFQSQSTSTRTDPRENDIFLDPDYHLTQDEVYLALAMKILCQLQDANLLSAVQHNGSYSLPSWVPDWTNDFTHALAPPYAELGHRTSSGIGAKIRLIEKVKFDTEEKKASPLIIEGARSPDKQGQILISVNFRQLLRYVLHLERTGSHWSTR